MDEQNTTPQTATPEAEPSAPAEGAAPSAEQQNAFTKFMHSLFSGKDTAAPAAEKDNPPTKPTEQPAAKLPASGKSYTETELQAALEAQKKQWETAAQEAARLEKLAPEERVKAETEARDQELTKLKAQLLERDLRAEAVSRLEKDGFPVGLADLLTYTDKDTMEKSLTSLTEMYKENLSAGVKAQLRGKTPEGLGGAARQGGSTRDVIAQNIRGGLM